MLSLEMTSKEPHSSKHSKDPRLDVDALTTNVFGGRRVEVENMFISGELRRDVVSRVVGIYSVISPRNFRCHLHPKLRRLLPKSSIDPKYPRPM
jgi:hypothetical protein